MILDRALSPVLNPGLRGRAKELNPGLRGRAKKLNFGLRGRAKITRRLANLMEMVEYKWLWATGRAGFEEGFLTF